MEQVSNLYAATLAAPYVAGSGVIVVTSAGTYTQGTFSLTILDGSGNVLLIFRVTAVTGTAFSGAAEGADVNAALGSAVVGSMWTQASKQQIGYDYTDLLADNRAGLGGTFASASAKAHSVAASGSLTLLNYSGGPGYVAEIWMAIATGDATTFADGNITITVDGEGTPAINVRLPLFFCAEYLANGGAAANHYGRYIQLNQGGGGVSVCFRFPIPFVSSIEIVVTNGSTGSAADFWYEVNYVTGVPNNWPYTQKLWCASGTLNDQTVDTAETLVDVSGTNPGRLLGAYLSIDSTPDGASPSTGPLEGAVQIYVDGGGSPVYQSSGTEDYFNSSFYFAGVPSGAGGQYVGYPFVGTGNNTWNCYRFHVPDMVLFANALKYVWNCGNSSYVNFTGGVRLAYCVFYYTEV